ncbi:DUF1648 domain-containing protein [Corynebacterium tapiri]|uniref:DUF1648 domain-containing protein n=1 Tax=Corynebacterium tapiri TaxID=1448266 RepID=A0A5C4U689_9CORY|nr:DUF1648 domain-containing protein [Corynebacterium tapiri]TNL99412.1 DUF1648 domain-containing protein [Corynebacterium tapiri]
MLARIPWHVSLVGHALLLGVLVAGGFATFGAVPDPIPTHFDAAGNADAWSTKTLTNWLVQILLGPGILTVVFAGSAGLIRAVGSEVGEANTRAKLRHKVALKGQANALLSSGFLLSLVLGLAVPAATLGWNIPGWLILLGIFAACASIFVGMAQAHKNADRAYPRQEGEPRMLYGLLYYDPNDSRVMVSDELGANYQPNVATRGGKAIVYGFVAVMLIAMVVVFGQSFWAA